MKGQILKKNSSYFSGLSLLTVCFCLFVFCCCVFDNYKKMPKFSKYATKAFCSNHRGDFAMGVKLS